MTANGSNNKWIGKRTPRPDGADKVTGRAAFGADFSQPGMLVGKVLRSPHPHARIKSINLDKAAALPGVKAVMTSKDLVEFPWDKPAILGIQDLRFNSRNVMARDKALYAGHAVAAVAATSASIASRALKLIEVDYEVLPWVIDVDEAMQPVRPFSMSTCTPPPPRVRQRHRMSRASSSTCWATSRPASQRPRWSSSAASRPSRCIRDISSRTPAS
jgi:CO/xanthine dehydrogenase Mo-binding subunit